MKREKKQTKQTNKQSEKKKKKKEKRKRFRASTNIPKRRTTDLSSSSEDLLSSEGFLSGTACRLTVSSSGPFWGGADTLSFFLAI